MRPVCRLRAARRDDWPCPCARSRDCRFADSGFGTGAAAGGDFSQSLARRLRDTRNGDCVSHPPGRIRHPGVCGTDQQRFCCERKIGDLRCAILGSRSASYSARCTSSVPRFGLIGAAGSMLFGYSTSLFFCCQRSTQTGHTAWRTSRSILAWSRTRRRGSGRFCRSACTTDHRLAWIACRRYGGVGELLFGTRNRRHADAGGKATSAAIPPIV